MNFLQFADAHGLVIQHVRGDGQWHRVPTKDKPKHKNGSYKWLGDVAFVQNHAQMAEVAVWKADETAQIGPIDIVALRERQKAAERAELIAQHKAASEAIEALKTAKYTTHPYLATKGFPEEKMMVDDEGRLLVPMRDFNNYRKVNSIQRIEADGNKKFLYGGKARGSVFVLGNCKNQPRWFCEGLATGLSIRTALASMYRNAEVVVCFSASNMQHVATGQKGFVFADNDTSQTGQKAAQSIGLPWVMSPVVGEDCNDMHQRAGVPAVARWMREAYERQ